MSDFNKSQPATVVLFGLPFHDVTMAETFAYIDQLIEQRTPSYLVTANLDFAAQAHGDVELQRILVEAELVLCDGTPLVWASRLVGQPLRERVAGSDMVPRLAAHAEKKGYRIFLLGGAEESLQAAATNLKAHYPQLESVEYFSPPFAPLHEIDNSEILKRLQAARPDILLVAFGCPKQEKWIFMHYREMGIPCSIGVGATIDFLAGKFKRAPRWMVVLGMEWIFRLLQEPRRLIGRYTKDIIFLFRQIFRELRTLGRDSSLNSPSGSSFRADENLEVIEWKGALTALRKESFEAPSGTKPFIIDLSAVTSVDHVGLGILLRAMRPAWARDVPACVGFPSPAIRKAFQATGLGRVLPIAESEADAKSIMSDANLPGSSRAIDRTLTIAMPLRLTAANTRECHNNLLQSWERNPRARVLILDCSGISFMDSSGLGLLLQAKKLAESREGGSLKLSTPTENVLNVLRVSKLETFLMGS